MPTSDPPGRYLKDVRSEGNSPPASRTGELAGMIHEFSPILRKFLGLHQICQVAQEQSVGERGL